MWTRFGVFFPNLEFCQPFSPLLIFNTTSCFILWGFEKWQLICNTEMNSLCGRVNSKTDTWPNQAVCTQNPWSCQIPVTIIVQNTRTLTRTTETLHSSWNMQFNTRYVLSLVQHPIHKLLNDLITCYLSVQAQICFLYIKVMSILITVIHNHFNLHLSISISLSQGYVRCCAVISPDDLNHAHICGCISHLIY